MKQKQPISICIITKNECNVLKECLERLFPHVQNAEHEIVVVDTGSTDDTVGMCRTYTNSIYEFPWIHDFSAARNFAAQKAKNDWILCIDSDEYITSWDEDNLQQQINHNPQGIGGFSLLCTCGFGPNQYQSLSKVYRLYNRKYYQFERPIHEQINPFDSALGHPCFMTALTADHYSYSGSPEELSAKSKRNIELLEKELTQNPHDPYVLFQLGQSYYMVEDFEKALYYYDLGLSKDVDPRMDYVHTMVVSYGYTLINLKQYQRALDLEGIYDTFGHRADFVFLMGMIYLNNGLFEDAILQFQKATTYDTAEVVGANSFRAWHNIGVIYECAGFPEEAIKHYQKCGDFAPAKERLNILQNT
ncbi:MAG: glycosyltransferase [Lachnospiraceae bacterium]|nr:glycosyltransferase [Lachnospiraceae bacterium]